MYGRYKCPAKPISEKDARFLRERGSRKRVVSYVASFTLRNGWGSLILLVSLVRSRKSPHLMVNDFVRLPQT